MTGTRRANGESTLSDHPNRRGYYEAKVWMGTKPDGRPDRRHIERKSLPAVRRAVRELERKRDAGIAGKPGRVPTVEQMLTRHLDVVLTQRGRAPRTVDDYWSKCRNDIFPRWGGQRIDRLLPEQIEDGYAEMIRAGHAASHVRKVHAILSSAYEEQVKRGNVARNPCRLVEPPALRQPGQKAMLQDLKDADGQQRQLLVNREDGPENRQAGQKGQPQQVHPGDATSRALSHDVNNLARWLRRIQEVRAGPFCRPIWHIVKQC